MLKTHRLNYVRNREFLKRTNNDNFFTYMLKKNENYIKNYNTRTGVSVNWQEKAGQINRHMEKEYIERGGRRNEPM